MATEIVSRNATCKRCDSTNCTWQQGTSGKWYLSEIFLYNEGVERTDPRDFHSKYCGKPEIHAEKQREIMLAELAEKADREARAEKREQERRDHEADVLAAWLTLTPDERVARIDTLLKQKARELDGITMDYFTEYCRALQKAEEIQAEIDMCLDFDADLED